MSDSPVVLLGNVNPGQVSALYMMSVLNLIAQAEHKLIVRSQGSGPLICRARNLLLQSFLETNATHFLSVDSDIEFRPEALTRLLAHEVPIVGAHYQGLLEGGKKFPVGNVRDSKGFLEKASYKALKGRAGLKEVAAVGMGFTLVKREVIEKLAPVGPLWPFSEEMDENGQALGEDVVFCLRAEKEGYKTYLDLSTRVGHLKPTLVGG